MLHIRVAFVTSRFLPLLGGTETHVARVAEGLAALGADVTVLTVDHGLGLGPVSHEGAVVVRRFRAWPGRGDLFVSPGLLRAVSTGGYDVVHVQGVHTLLPPAALRAARRAGMRTVLTFHTGGHSSRLRTALRDRQWRAWGRALRRADALVAVSRYELERFATLLGLEPSRLHLIPNGADPLPVADTPPPLSGRPLIASVGRLERYKGHHRVIEALPSLRELHPEARVAVVGRGPYEGTLRELARRLGVEDAVTFTAFDHGERAELGSLLASSNVVTLLSEYEAHPVAVMEALGLGRRVVVADTSGLSELDRYELVRVVPLGIEPAALAAVLAEAAGAPPAPVPALPTWDDCVAALSRLYRDVLSRPPS
jgi:glycosyltransferase involved in cell wall biosynthesis